MLFRPLPWIRFTRLPAVMTVPGDVWVGAIVGGRSASWMEVGGVCCAYLFGMTLNDWWDRNRDAETRPERPLPAGEISAGGAGALSLALAVGSFLFLPGIPIFVLLCTVVAYTLLKNQTPLIGALLMGMCRFQSVWIGTGAERTETVSEWAVPLGAGLLIVFLTRLAQLEGTGKNGTVRSAFFAGGLVAAAMAGMFLGGEQGPASWALLGAVAGVAIANHAAIERNKIVPPSAVAIYLGMWIPLQAVWVLGAEQAAEGAFLVTAAIALPWLQRQISVS